VITRREPMLLDYLIVASQLPQDEQELYWHMTGLNFDPDTVAAQLYAAGGRRWAFADGHAPPVAVGGYTCAGPGVWRSWFMATPEAWKPHGKDVTARVRECIASMFKDESVQRLETVTLATRTRARAWYERIGLHYESTARAASASGQDLVTYVALRDANVL
jgi:RimJ/RimL family protein N-acetyltransferase